VNKLKIIYFINGGPNVTDGVNKKIFTQLSELILWGINVQMVFIHVGAKFSNHFGFVKEYILRDIHKKNILGRVKRARDINKIFEITIRQLSFNDILYCRYSNLCLLYFPGNYFKILRSCKLVTEHQTKELDEFKLTKNAISYWSEFFFGRLLKKQSNAFIGVTEEITQYELAQVGNFNIPHLTLGNGFNVQSVVMRRTPSNNDAGLVHLLCVANVNKWHGLDRLLNGLATYRGNTHIIFHIAGDGAEIQSLKQEREKLNLQDHVIFHGFKSGADLDELFNFCHIAVGSLGIHRKGLTQTSELKAREYCARGIPYIIACSDPDFPDDFPWILRVPADESPINIEEVIKFAQRAYADPDHPQKMRAYAVEHLDWSIKMKKLKAFLETLVDE
jgi:glycosyltransferase involved in cell wall biosynthesis